MYSSFHSPYFWNYPLVRFSVPAVFVFVSKYKSQTFKKNTLKKGNINHIISYELITTQTIFSKFFWNCLFKNRNFYRQKLYKFVNIDRISFNITLNSSHWLVRFVNKPISRFDIFFSHICEYMSAGVSDWPIIFAWSYEVDYS